MRDNKDGRDDVESTRTPHREPEKNHMTDLIIQERCCLMTMTITMMMLITIAEI